MGKRKIGFSLQSRLKHSTITNLMAAAAALKETPPGFFVFVCRALLWYSVLSCSVSIVYLKGIFCMISYSSYMLPYVLCSALLLLVTVCPSQVRVTVLQYSITYRITSVK